jgi:cation diffusion facilitator family transporter
MDHTVPRCTACTSGAEKPQAAEGRALVVAIVTLVDMVAEIVFGLVTGSMALLADGIHMGTHALALGVTVVAYVLARKWRQNPGFAFGTGKIGVLGAYTNALLLGGTALFMVVESVQRFLHPQAIEFDLALWVAGLGLVVNLVSALVLGGGHHHDHDHDHPHEHDSNLKAALAHVLADAMTSVLAIGALLAARVWGWNWLDPAVGLVGAGLILSWAWGLLKDSGAMLLDFGRWHHDEAAIVEKLANVGAEVRDLHIWRYGEDQRSLVLAVSPAEGASSPEEVRTRLGDLVDDFGHVTIEVRRG